MKADWHVLFALQSLSREKKLDKEVIQTLKTLLASFEDNEGSE